eukprot:193111-Chlamydomonas_euryale.AAC.7
MPPCASVFPPTHTRISRLTALQNTSGYAPPSASENPLHCRRATPPPQQNSPGYQQAHCAVHDQRHHAVANDAAHMV